MTKKMKFKSLECEQTTLTCDMCKNPWNMFSKNRP